MSSNRYLIDRIGDDSTAADWNTTPGEYGLCFSCHARRGDIAQTTPVGKEIAGRDWFNVTAMGSRLITYRYTDGNPIGSRVVDSETTFADMFRSRGVDLANPIPDPTTSGHRSEKVVSPTDTRFTAAYRAQTTSVRCTGCHDVHKSQLAASTVMGEWPLTQKAVPNGVLIWRNNLSSAGFSADRWRLITLNDYWNPPATRVDILCFKCHEASVAMATLAHSAADPVGKYGGDAGRDHKNSFIACVSCHTPGVHGSGMPYLLADATSVADATNRVMPSHQVMRWYNPRTLVVNDPVAKLVSVNPADVKNPDRMGCSTSGEYGCHTQLYSQWRIVGDQTGPGWVNWR